MDASELAQKMLEWEKRRKELDALESQIQEVVLEMGRTQTVGNVRASYSRGRRSFDYEQPVVAMRERAITEADEDKIVAVNTAVSMHTETVVTTNWKNVCETLSLEPVVAKQSPPSVTVKLL